MKVNLFVSKDNVDSHADIYVNELTDSVLKAISILENENHPDLISVKNGKDIIFLEFKDIFMFRVENKQVVVYTFDKQYIIKKPLYQIENLLNDSFIRISKSTIINLKKIEKIAPSLKGMVFIQLKNGLKDNISRKYLPNFKESLKL